MLAEGAESALATAASKRPASALTKMILRMLLTLTGHDVPRAPG